MINEPADGADPGNPLRERFAEVRGEHGWARYVDDETLAAWLRPAAARRGDGPEEQVAEGPASS